MSQCRVAPDGKISLIDFAGKTYPFLTPSRCAERIRRHLKLHPYRLADGHISKFKFPKQRGQRAGTWVCTPEIAAEVVGQFASDWNVRPSRRGAQSRVRDQPLEPGLAATVSHLESIRDGFAVLAQVAPDTTSVLEPAADETVGTVGTEEETVPPFKLLTPVLAHEQDWEKEYDFNSFPEHDKYGSFSIN